jgi:ABC-type multidrug transport system ATPase subunit
MSGSGPDSQPESDALSPSAIVLVVDRLTARLGPSACEDVSFSIPAGSIHALLGDRAAGKAAIIASVLGQRRPSAGHVWIAGRDTWRNRRALSGWVEAVTPEARVRGSATLERLSKRRSRSAEIWDEKGFRERLRRLDVPTDESWKQLTIRQRMFAILALALAASPRLVVLPDTGISAGSEGDQMLISEMRGAASSGISLLVATERPDEVEAIADRVSILRFGRLVLNGDCAQLKSGFRRIRYRNEVHSQRAEYGNELDEFEAVQVRVRGWGVEAVVSNFSDSTYDRFRQIPGVVDVQALAMSWAEILEAVGRPQRANPVPSP